MRQGNSLQHFRSKGGIPELVLGMNFQTVTGATMDMWREVELLTGRRNIELLIGGVGETLIYYFKVCLRSAFLQSVVSGPNS